MNCTQVHELLPLYAGRDLDEKRARLVSEHVQSCAACARVAGEYQDTVELTQNFPTPVFSDDLYASVRRQVWQQIEREPAAPVLPQMFASWFRPRMAWAAASALIIAFGFLALYLIVKRDADVQPVAQNQPAVVEQQPPTPTPTTTPASSGTMEKHLEYKRRGSRAVKRATLVTAKVQNSSSTAAAISPMLREPEEANSLPAHDAVPGESPLRVEIQTKDPNIRIIWFSQPNSKRALPNAKGI